MKYEVEKVARQKQLRGEDLRLVREEDALPILTMLHGYLLTIRGQVLPKSEAGQAIAYTLKNWTALIRYCSDGDLSIDNNATERSLRSFAVGRNNWTFFGSDGGGKTAAVLRSFISSCEIVRIDPFAWFKDVLGRIPEYPVKRIGELLPHRWAQAFR
jgi:transposase